MKFRAHETFFIRKGWLSKGMKYVSLKPNVFVSKDENPMDVLGIGSNMVKSLRYWLQVTGLTEEGKGKLREQHLTEMGSCVFENDRYLEEMGTLYLLQYKLATNVENATAWYFFFNEFNMSEFSKEDFVIQIQKFIAMENKQVADNSDIENKQIVHAIRSLEDDFSCIVNTYLPRYKSNPGRVSAENNIDCPLGELGLIDIVSRKSYRKAIPNTSTIDPWIALAILIEQSNGAKEVVLNNLLVAPCSLGKIFNLDALGLLEVLRSVEKIGEIKVIRTAGLDVVQILNKRSFMECVEHYYASINEQFGSGFNE